MRKVILFILSFAVFFLLTSCNWLQKEVNEMYSNNEKINLIVTNSELLINQNELLSSLKMSSRSATIAASDIISNSELSNEDLGELTNFLNSPSSYINESIETNEAGFNENLNLIYSIYNESTIDEVISNMEEVSVEMSEDFKQSVSSFYTSLNSSARSAIDEHGGIGSQKVYIFQDESNNNGVRSVTFETDLSWESVARYVGYSAASIAGACCYKWVPIPWIKYPGLAVCLSGIGCMGTLMARWSCSPKLIVVKTSIKSIVNSIPKIIKLKDLTDEEKRNKFLSDLANDLQNYVKENHGYEYEIGKILSHIEETYIGVKSFYDAIIDIVTFCMSDGETGKQLATVGVSTSAVAVSCWFTGVASLLQNSYLALIDFIPDWLVITADSISIVLTF